jgi:peptidoglycan/LPS O-acetylase OafA/YrhL
MDIMTLTYVFYIAPALLIGTVFGALVALTLGGNMNLKSAARAVTFSVVGAAGGIVIALLTASWWNDPVVGLYMLSPSTGIAMGVISQRRKRNG